MATLVSPVGRFVQGDLFELNTKNMQGGERRNQKGELSPQAVCVLAIDKRDPGWPAFEASVRQVAAAGFPHLFPQGATGPCTLPTFSFKIQDGDGVDGLGRPNSGKPGHAGCWIVKFTSGYLPKVYPKGQFGPHQQISDRSVVKLGYYIRVGYTLQANGNQTKPGVFVNHTFIEHVAYGDEIILGPSAADVFGAVAPAYLPPGASATPVLGNVPASVLGAATPSLAAAPPSTASPGDAGPYAGYRVPPARVMTPAAQGIPYEAYVAQGWTEDTLRAAGLLA